MNYLTDENQVSINVEAVGLILISKESIDCQCSTMGFFNRFIFGVNGLDKPLRVDTHGGEERARKMGGRRVCKERVLQSLESASL